MELTAVEPRQPKRRFWLKFILLVCFLTCLVVGLSSLTALLLIRNGSVAALNNTSLPMIDRAAVSPELAINQLAGDPADALALQAANAGALETAHAILAFDAATAPKKQAALYQLLSRRIAESSLPQTVRQQKIDTIQRQARSLAVLAPDIEHIVRGQLLLQGAQDLLTIEESESALLSAINLQRLVEQLPDLLPAQRRQMLEPLKPFVEQLNSPVQAQRLSELLRNPFLTPTGILLPLKLPAYRAYADNTISAPTDEPIHAAVTAREEAARRLAGQVRLLAEQDDTLRGDQIRMEANVRAELIQLSDALRLEEATRQQVWTPQLSDESKLPEEKLHILFERHQWTVLKARIAAGGFGLSIVPEWENGLPTIEQELTGITQEIDSTIDLLMETLAEPKDKAALRVEKFLWIALQAERGLYPGASLPLLSNDLRFAQAELANQGIELALPVLWNPALDEPEFQFQAK